MCVRNRVKVARNFQPVDVAVVLDFLILPMSVTQGRQNSLDGSRDGTLRVVNASPTNNY